jgi:peptide/nickel transport system substrate-binding protein
MLRRVATSLVTALVLTAFVLGLGSQVPAQVAERPRYGGTLIKVLGANPSMFNAAITADHSVVSVGCTLYNGLVFVDRRGQPQPELARAWEIRQGGREIAFQLQRNVKWHDGAPFTSADVKFTMESMLAKYHPRSQKAFADVTAIEIPDAHTVVVKFRKVFAPFLTVMGCSEAPILPRHLYEGTDPLKNPRNLADPVGTGPFKLAEFVRGSHLTVVRNPDYFLPGLPYLDRIVFKIIPDAAGRLLAFEKGEVDYIESTFFPKQEHRRLKDNPAFQWQTDSDQPNETYLMFNTQRGPTRDRRVRQALVMAADRKLALERAAFGLGQPGRGPIDSRFPWAFNAEATYDRLYPFDPVRAAKMLDEAGYPKKADGVRFDLQMVYMTEQPDLPASAEVLRSNWRDIGVNVVLEGVERQVMYQRVYATRNYDVTVQGYTSAGDPAAGIQRVYNTDESRNNWVNPTGYSNLTVDELFAKAAGVFNLEERGRAYRELGKILAEDVPTVVLIEKGSVDYGSAKFGGFGQSVTFFNGWDRVWWRAGREKP